MNSINLLKLKNHHSLQVLDTEISNLFNIKTYHCKKNRYKNNHDKTFISKKDNVSNKTLFILNKVSSNNIDNLLKEYMIQINFVEEDEFNDIQQTFFIKLLEDIKFLNYYLNFILQIFNIYKTKNIEPSYFIKLLQDYFESITTAESKNKIFEKYYEENYKQNFYIILKKLIELKFFNSNIISHIDNVLINSTNTIDIYSWFQGRELSKEYVEKLKLHRSTIKEKRYIYIIDNLINNKTTKVKEKENPIKKETKIDQIEQFKNEVINILEEYLFINSIEEVDEFIKEQKNNYQKIKCFNELLSEFLKKNPNKNKELTKLKQYFSNNSSINV